jgi:hypothetical protein
MKNPLRHVMPIGLIVVFGVTMCGCTTFETSTDITTAPFDLTSTTSGRSPSPHGPAIQAERFVTQNFEDLRQDMAQGRGEYIFSLGTLLGIAGPDLSQFAGSMQASPLIRQTMTPQAMWDVLRQEVRPWPTSARD